MWEGMKDADRPLKSLVGWTTAVEGETRHSEEPK